MLLGDPPERVELAAGERRLGEPGTGIQMRNESDAEVTSSSPTARRRSSGQAELLDDVEL